MNHEPGEFTRLLTAYHAGSEEARNAMIALVYADLRQLARRNLGGSRWLDSLGTTQLVHESYLRLVSPAARNVGDRNHFMNLASRIMRQLICDYARRRVREAQRFEHGVLEADDGEIAQPAADEAKQLIGLDDGLTDLAKINERQVRVIECRFFSGLSEEETASALDISVRTVQREWAEARDWLAQHMKAD